MAEIELINVSKSWGDFKAVVDFNLTIKNNYNNNRRETFIDKIIKSVKKKTSFR